MADTVKPEHGKDYKTRGGLKASKGRYRSKRNDWVFEVDGTTRVFSLDGVHHYGNRSLDLVAEWTDEPAAPSELEAIRAKLADMEATLAIRDRESDFLKRRGNKALARAEAAEAKINRLLAALGPFADRERWFKTSHRPDVPGPYEPIVFFSTNPWRSDDLEPWKAVIAVIEREKTS